MPWALEQCRPRVEAPTLPSVGQTQIARRRHDSHARPNGESYLIGYLIASATLRIESIKVLTIGLYVRFFKVTVAVVKLLISRFTGNTRSGYRSALNRKIEPEFRRASLSP